MGKHPHRRRDPEGKHSRSELRARELRPTARRASGREVKSVVIGSGRRRRSPSLAKQGRRRDVYVVDDDAFANYSVHHAGQQGDPRRRRRHRRRSRAALEHAERLGRRPPPRRGPRRRLRERLLQDRRRAAATSCSTGASSTASSTRELTASRARRRHHAARRHRRLRGIDRRLKRQRLDVSLDGAARAKFVEIKQAESTGVDLTKADVIVSGGRGVGDPEKFPEVIQPLADALGGAMGASRPVVDAGWLPHEYQVGSSGQVVRRSSTSPAGSRERSSTSSA